MKFDITTDLPDRQLRSVLRRFIYGGEHEQRHNPSNLDLAESSVHTHSDADHRCAWPDGCEVRGGGEWSTRPKA